jgi:hypothetical protein
VTPADQILPPPYLPPPFYGVSAVLPSLHDSLPALTASFYRPERRFAVLYGPFERRRGLLAAVGFAPLGADASRRETCAAAPAPLKRAVYRGGVLT